MFLNNVSLGIYGDAVRNPAYRDAKVRTLLETAEQVLGPSGQAPALRLADDTGHGHAHLGVVLVSNNPYGLERPLVRGSRPALDAGQLGIVILDLPRDSPDPLGRAWSAPRLEVNTPAPVHAGVDGDYDHAEHIRQDGVGEHSAPDLGGAQRGVGHLVGQVGSAIRFR